MTEAFYSPREKIAPLQKISVVGVNFLRPNNGGVISLKTVIVNNSPEGEFCLLGVHEKIAPLCKGRFFQGGENLTCHRRLQLLMSSHLGIS